MVEGYQSPNKNGAPTDLLEEEKQVETLETFWDSIDRRNWVPDAKARQCYRCGRDFSLLTRRHHCRKCGRVFCARCIRNKEVNSVTAKICLNCEKDYNNYINTLALKRNLLDEPIRRNSDMCSSDSPSTPSQEGGSMITPSTREDSLRFTNVEGNAQNEPSFFELTIADTRLAKSGNDAKAFGGLAPNPDLTLAKSVRTSKMITNYLQELQTDENHRQLNATISSDKAALSKLHELSRQHIRKIVANQLSAANLPLEKWHKILEEFATRAVEQVKPSSKVLSDQMDINEFIKIKVIDWKDQQKCQFVNGIVLNNSLADRRMASEITNPRILLLQDSFGVGNNDSDLQSLIDDEEQLSKILNKKLDTVNANLILIEKDIPFKSLRLLRERNISVVCNIKDRKLRSMARLTQTILCPSINVVEKNFILGKCKHFKLINLSKEMVHQGRFYDAHKEDTTLLIFDGCNPALGCTILLSGPLDQEQEELKRVKATLKKILTLARNIILERAFLFSIQCQVPKTLQVDEPDSKNSPFLITHLIENRSTLVFQQTIIISKKHKQNQGSQVIEESSTTVFMQIEEEGKEEVYRNKNQDQATNNASGSLHEQIKQEKEKTINEKYVQKQLDKLCGTPTKQKIIFNRQEYQKDNSPKPDNDSTFGMYLEKLQKIWQRETCGGCLKAQSSHMIELYHNEGKLVINVVNSRDPSKKLDRDHRERYLNNTLSDSITTRAEMFGKQAEPTKSDEIKLYMQCAVCQQCTSRSVMSNSLYEYSTGRMFEQYFYNDKLKLKNSVFPCQHGTHPLRSFVQCFELRSCKIMFKYVPLDIYSIQIVSPKKYDNSECLRDYIKSHQDKTYDILVKAMENLKDQVAVLKKRIQRCISTEPLDYTKTHKLKFFKVQLDRVLKVIDKLENGFKMFIQEAMRDVMKLTTQILHYQFLRKKIFVTLLSYQRTVDDILKVTALLLVLTNRRLNVLDIVHQWKNYQRGSRNMMLNLTEKPVLPNSMSGTSMNKPNSAQSKGGSSKENVKKEIDPNRSMALSQSDESRDEAVENIKLDQEPDESSGSTEKNNDGGTTTSGTDPEVSATNVKEGASLPASNSEKDLKKKQRRIIHHADTVVMPSHKKVEAQNMTVLHKAKTRIIEVEEPLSDGDEVDPCFVEDLCTCDNQPRSQRSSFRMSGNLGASNQASRPEVDVQILEAETSINLGRAQFNCPMTHQRSHNKFCRDPYHYNDCYQKIAAEVMATIGEIQTIFLSEEIVEEAKMDEECQNPVEIDGRNTAGLGERDSIQNYDPHKSAQFGGALQSPTLTFGSSSPRDIPNNHQFVHRQPSGAEFEPPTDTQGRLSQGKPQSVATKPIKNMWRKIFWIKSLSNYYLSMPLGINNAFVQINPKDVGSIIAFALNSNIYVEGLAKQNYMELQAKIQKHSLDAKAPVNLRPQDPGHFVPTQIHLIGRDDILNHKISSKQIEGEMIAPTKISYRVSFSTYSNDVKLKILDGRNLIEINRTSMHFKTGTVIMSTKTKDSGKQPDNVGGLKAEKVQGGKGTAKTKLNDLQQILLPRITKEYLKQELIRESIHELESIHSEVNSHYFNKDKMQTIKGFLARGAGFSLSHMAQNKKKERENSQGRQQTDQQNQAQAVISSLGLGVFGDDEQSFMDDSVRESFRQPASKQHHKKKDEKYVPPPVPELKIEPGSIFNVDSPAKSFHHAMMHPQKSLNEELKVPKIDFEVKIYYPKRFQALNRFYCGTHLQYIESLCKTNTWSASGGKAAQSFFLTHDNKYVFKSVKKSEFKMFIEFGPTYFDYICKAFFHNYPCCLAKILGAFVVKVSSPENRPNSPQKYNFKQYLLLSENLNLGIKQEDEPNIVRYDLKGSEINRFVVQPNLHGGPASPTFPALEESQLQHDVFSRPTLLDTNFCQQMNGRPLVLKISLANLFHHAVHNDTLCLTKQNIIDYSMLAIMNTKKKTVRFGIIDYLQIYTFDRQLEKTYKQVINLGKTGTITEPKAYRHRFKSFIKNSFLGIWSQRELVISHTASPDELEYLRTEHKQEQQDLLESDSEDDNFITSKQKGATYEQLGTSKKK